MKGNFTFAKCAVALSLPRERKFTKKKLPFWGPIFQTLIKRNAPEDRKPLSRTLPLNEYIPSCIPCLQADQKDMVEPVLLLSPSDIVVSSQFSAHLFLL